MKQVIAFIREEWFPILAVVLLLGAIVCGDGLSCEIHINSRSATQLASTQGER